MSRTFLRGDPNFGLAGTIIIIILIYRPSGTQLTRCYLEQFEGKDNQSNPIFIVLRCHSDVAMP